MSDGLDYEIPKFQKAIVATEKGNKPKLEVVDNFPVPDVGQGEILVRLTSSGVCQSDISGLTGHWGFVMECDVCGHEGSGYIVKHGAGVDIEKFPRGMRVGVSLISNPCRTCRACRLPDGESLCKNATYYGTHLNGTWQQYVVVKDSYVIPLPKGLTESQLLRVGPILCAGVTAYKALKTSGKGAGDFCVITGAGGGVGSLGVQFAREMGMRVIAVDSGEDKRILTKELGAEFYIDFMTENVVEKVLEVTNGRGSDAVMMFAPSEFSYNQALNYIGLKGCLVCVGLPGKDIKLQFPPSKVIYTGVSVKGSLVGSRSDILEALDFVARGKVDASVKVMSMNDINEILDSMLSNKVAGRIVLDLT